MIEVTSEFFSKQLKAKDQFKNELTFTYLDYSKACISIFLNIVHGVSWNWSDDYGTTLELIKFLQFEGKSGLVFIIKRY